MKKLIIIFAALILSFSLGWVLSYHFREPKVVTITEEKIVANTITKDVESMPCREAKDDLYCFYTGFPSLSISHIGGDEYLLNAELCERKWSRQASIKSVSKQYRNMVIAGLFIDSGLNTGVNAQYYRMYGRWGIGGGLSLSMGYLSAMGGVVWVW